MGSWLPGCDGRLGRAKVSKVSRPPENILIQKHFIELLREGAGYYEREAFTGLQMAQSQADQIYFAEQMEVWKSVQILLAQRDKLQKYVRLLIKAEGEEQTANAAREYLEEIGIEL